MLLYTGLQHFLFYGKIAGATVSFSGLAGLFYKIFISPVHRRVKGTFDTVQKLATNHLPHIQQALEVQDKTLGTLVVEVAESKAQIAGYAEKLQNTNELLGTLHTALLDHLNNVSPERAAAEKPKRRKNAIRF